MIVTVTIDEKMYKALVPDDAPESLWMAGVILGPPDLSSLGLPRKFEVRLHNELFVRGLITRDEAFKYSNEVLGALQAALKVDVQLIAQIYLQEQGVGNG